MATIHDIIESGSLDEIKTALKDHPHFSDENNNNFLHIAILKNRPDIIEYLIECDHNLIWAHNRDDKPPLTLALEKCRYASVEQILKIININYMIMLLDKQIFSFLESANHTEQEIKSIILIIQHALLRLKERLNNESNNDYDKNQLLNFYHRLSKLFLINGMLSDFEKSILDSFQFIECHYSQNESTQFSNHAEKWRMCVLQIQDRLLVEKSIQQLIEMYEHKPDYQKNWLCLYFLNYFLVGIAKNSNEKEKALHALNNQIKYVLYDPDEKRQYYTLKYLLSVKTKLFEELNHSSEKIDRINHIAKLLDKKCRDDKTPFYENLKGKINEDRLHDAASLPDGCDIVKDMLDFDSISVNAMHSKCQMQPIGFAVKFDNEETVKFLLARGASIDASEKETNLFEIALVNHSDHMIYFFADSAQHFAEKFNDGTTPLHLLAGAGRVEEVREMLQEHPDLALVTNNKKQTPLDYAEKNNHFDVFEVLIDNISDDKTLLNYFFEYFWELDSLSIRDKKRILAIEEKILSRAKNITDRTDKILYQLACCYERIGKLSEKLSPETENLCVFYQHAVDLATSIENKDANVYKLLANNFVNLSNLYGCLESENAPTKKIYAQKEKEYLEKAIYYVLLHKDNSPTDEEEDEDWLYELYTSLADLHFLDDEIEKAISAVKFAMGYSRSRIDHGSRNAGDYKNIIESFKTLFECYKKINHELSMQNTQTMISFYRAQYERLFKTALSANSRTYTSSASLFKDYTKSSQDEIDDEDRPLKFGKKTIADEFGFECLNVVSFDGNCFFTSMVYSLSNIPKLKEYNHHDLRRIMIEHIAEYKKVYEEIIGNVHDYIYGLGTPGMACNETWADDYAIAALSCALNITIAIVMSDRQYQVYKPSHHPVATVILANFVGSHFMPTKSISNINPEKNINELIKQVDISYIAKEINNSFSKDIIVDIINNIGKRKFFVENSSSEPNESKRMKI